MTRQADQLARARDVIDRTLQRADGRPILEVALERAEAWAHDQLPVEGERGSTSTPMSREEAEERRRVQRLALKAVERIPAISAQMVTLADELYGYVQRLSAVVDHTKLPAPPAEGCQSCARTEQRGQVRIGGFFAPVYAKAVTAGLCRWCWSHNAAEGEWPPLDAVELYHRQSPRAAGLYLAKLYEQPA